MIVDVHFPLVGILIVGDADVRVPVVERGLRLRGQSRGQKSRQPKLAEIAG